MKFGKLEINPAKNPAILDTATWDTESVVKRIQHLPKEYLEQLYTSVIAGLEIPDCDGFTPYKGSLAQKRDRIIFLAGLPDGQQIFVEYGKHGQEPMLGKPLWQMQILEAKQLDIYKADAEVIDCFFRDVSPVKGPRAWGGIPRLGIGVRMTTACWPGIIAAMNQKSFNSNMIQNSVRELNTMSTLLDAVPADKNYACGFGTIETGYTGSSFEGLWVSGALETLKSECAVCYGADADHIQVKRGTEGVTRARRIIDCAKYYTFYTIDVSDILDYGAMMKGSACAGEDYLKRKIPKVALQNEVIKYHQQGWRVGGNLYEPDETMLGRFVAKYWDALEVMEEITGYIKTIKVTQAFDLEFAIDEHPPDVSAFDCLTTDEEIIFVLLELRRRGLTITHIAPNFGVEKGMDYRCPCGLKGFENRVASQFSITEEFGVMMDFHSADDLGSCPREVIKRATGGKHHFKISPILQIIYADVLRDFHPGLFHEWWNDAMSYARREAGAGSEFAKGCIKEYEVKLDKNPSPRDMVFHHYSFAFVGKRDKNGQFLHRERFYNLSMDFYEKYKNRLVSYLGKLAYELF